MADRRESLWRRVLTDQRVAPLERAGGAETGVAAIGTAASLTALFSAAACCVLPLALAAVGLGAGGLSFLVPYHWPLTVGSAVAVAAGWFLYLRKRRACSSDSACTSTTPTKATLVILCVATAFVFLSALWPSFIEQPLMRALGGN